MSGASIGIMDPAFFVSRSELLSFLNDTFKFSPPLAKIEDTCSGAVALQMMDAIYPGEVPMSKVKWNARSDFEYVHNYKLLQRVFDKKQIPKHIEVEKLIRGKYQDNLEFMQWFKSFYDKNHSGATDYDPVTRRKGGKGGAAFSSAGNRRPAGGGRGRATKPAGSGRGEGKASGAPVAGGAPASGARRGTGSARATASSAGSSGSSAAMARRVEQLDTQVADLKLSVEGLEKERDFYFGKLRDIEILLQAYSGPDEQVAKQIFTILYATEEDFVVVDEEQPEEDGGVAAPAVDDKENHGVLPAARAAPAAASTEPVGAAE